jgi:7-cyano-7-deazaguanine synthase in queuosine biosynthesis
VHAVALGTLKGNPFPDSTREFFDEFAALAERAMGNALEVLTPYAERTKAEVIERGRGLELQHTFSCIDPARRAPLRPVQQVCREEARVQRVGDRRCHALRALLSARTRTRA